MRWQIKSNLPSKSDPSSRLEAIKQLLFKHRGLEDEKSRLNFLSSDVASLDKVTSYLQDLDFNQLKLAQERIQQAIKDKQPIIVYGDYDCDGVCSTAILWETLHLLGAQATPFIPNRITHGYGLSEKGLVDALKLFPNQVPLIITVDNGIRAHAAAQFLKSKKIDLIITDHHVAAKDGDKTDLPPAVAIVHTTHLCGAGVAWVLSSNLRPDVPTDLVALATVCDQMPLLGANRLLVKSGLQELKRTKRPGLQALYSIAQITDTSKIDTYHLGFVLGPRINAAGRMGNAIDALRLLCTKNSQKAYEYAQILQETNQNRQELTQDFTRIAIGHFAGLDEPPKVLFFTHDQCPEGLLGLIASKLTETYSRPSIVLSTGEALVKGSARSVTGVNITTLLSQASDHLQDFGGHELAAGLTTSQENVEPLRIALEKLSQSIDESLLEKTLQIETNLLPDDINRSLLDLINQLSPFGMGNPQPLFATTVEKFKYRLIGATKQHVKVNFPEANFEAIAFGKSQEFTSHPENTPLNLAFSLEENIYQGRSTLQLNVKDLKSDKIASNELPTIT